MDLKRQIEKSLSKSSSLIKSSFREIAGPCPQALPALQKADMEISQSLDRFTEFSQEAMKLQALLERKVQDEIRTAMI